MNGPCWILKAYSDSNENRHRACELDFLQKSSLEWTYFPPFRFRYNAEIIFIWLFSYMNYLNQSTNQNNGSSGRCQGLFPPHLHSQGKAPWGRGWRYDMIWYIHELWRHRRSCIPHKLIRLAKIPPQKRSKTFLHYYLPPFSEVRSHTYTSN